MEKKFLNNAVAVFILSILSFAPIISHAASLNFSPSSGLYTVGTTFSVNVYVESNRQAMNAASGVIAFPQDKLEVVSLSKQSSIILLWPVEPSFSNSQGTVSFEGIALNPGYIGTNGKLLSITFRVRSAGVANMSFSSGSVLANDGIGTNILDGLRVANYTLRNAVAPTPVQEQVGPILIGDGPTITSITHPDENRWYAHNTPEFSWQLSAGALEVRTLISRSPSAIPSVSHIPPISERKIDELPDGTHYFALRVRTISGWGATSRYSVNIDTTSPRPFQIIFPHGNTGWNPQPVVLFSTTDIGSGISHYDISVGSETETLKSAPLVSSPYALPPQFPGTYTLIVTAVDNAGNVRNSSAEFTIEAIDAPIITYYPETLEEGEFLKVRGTTYPNSDVTVYIREGDTLVSEEHARSNTTGDFVVVSTRQLDTGIYTITARVKDERGAQSNETVPLTVTARPEFMAEIISFILKYLSAAILILFAIGSIIWIGMHLWFKLLRSIERMRREAREAEQVSKRAFKVLRDGVAEHVTRLKRAKRKLTDEEAEFLKQFDEKLEEAEEIIEKEIRDISQSS